MVASSNSLLSMQSLPKVAATRLSGLNFAAHSNQRRSSLSFRVKPVPARFQISCVASTRFSGVNFPAHLNQERSSLSFIVKPVPARFRTSCIAKPETVEKVCAIVKKQLALGADTAVTGESKFAALGADSLDTVEIVMGLEEEFGISVEEESAQSIATVQDAANLIEKLIQKK